MTSSNMKLRTKIFGMALILLIITLIVSFAGIISMRIIGEEIYEVAEEDIPMTIALTEVVINQLEQAIWFERILRHGKEAGDSEEEAKSFEQALKEFNEHGKLVVEMLENRRHFMWGESIRIFRGKGIKLLSL